MDKIISPKVPQSHKTDFFTKEEGLRLLNGSPGTWAGIRTRAMVALFLYAGLRRLEVSRLNVASIDFDHRCIRVYGKGKKWRPVPLDEKLLPPLVHWLEVRQQYLDSMGQSDAEALFISRTGKRMCADTVYMAIRRLGERLELKGKVWPHKFRHTFGTEFIADGGDIRVVQEIMGHSCISTTQRYTHVTAERLMAEFDRVQAKRKAKEGRDLFPTKL